MIISLSSRLLSRGKKQIAIKAIIGNLWQSLAINAVIGTEDF
jgi:hypothetical protein